MINIAIDEKACVGCSLCVETCVPGVFTFDEARALPQVAKPRECFGCLACAEICPADAIAHDGVQLQESYYHDPYALKLASRLSTNGRPQPLVPADSPHRQAALRDLGVRLLAVAAVFKQTLGAGLPAVGTLAGRTLASQLPRYRPPRSAGEALALAREQLAPAWELEPTLTGDTLTVGVKGCFVREVCEREGMPLGGELCVLFYNYLAGYLGRMGGFKLRLVQAERGHERCSYQVKVF